MNSLVLFYPPSLSFAPGLVSGLSREKHSQINAKEPQERRPFQKATRVGQTGPLPLPRSDSLKTISHPSTIEEKLMTDREGGERERRKEEGGGGKEGVRQASSPHHTCSSFKGIPSQVLIACSLTSYPAAFSSQPLLGAPESTRAQHSHQPGLFLSGL